MTAATTLAATVGVTEMLEVRARWKTKHHVEPLEVRVLVTGDRADIKPVTAVGRITKSGLDSPLFFKLTPLGAGHLRIRTFIYDNDSGFLLKEVVAALPVVESGTARRAR